MRKIPLTQSGPTDKFTASVQAYRNACEAQMMGNVGKPAPHASPLIESLVRRVPQDGPVASRGPDQIVIDDYEIIDDRLVTPDVQFLRNSIKT